MSNYNTSKETNALFLHGFAMKASVWDDFLDGATIDYKAHRIDLYDIEVDSSETKNLFEVWAHFIHRYINKHSLDNVILVGHSMGGYVALETLKISLNNIIGLVLFHSHPFADSLEKKELRNKTISFIQDHGKEKFYKSFFPNLFYQHIRHLAIINRVIHNSTIIPKKSIILSIEGMKNRVDNHILLNSLPFPTYWILGGKDTLISPNIGANLSLSTDNIVIHNLDNVGHMGMFEALSKCHKIINEYIDIISR